MLLELRLYNWERTAFPIKDLSLPHLPAGNHHQQRASGYAADFLQVAPELPPVCLALLAEFFGVFGLVAAALFAGVPEFLSHRGSPWQLDSIF